MTKASNIVLFDPYKVKLKQKLNGIDFKYDILRLEISENESLSAAEKNWKVRKLEKDFDHDKYWTKKMLDLYDNIMSME